MDIRVLGKKNVKKQNIIKFMSAYMGAGSVRIGVQVQGCPLVNTTSRRKIKERVMYVLLCPRSQL